MSGLIDYAGLFPPANLDLETAITNYSNYIRSTDRWMMSKFILPAAKMADLTDELMEQFSRDHPLNLSLITTDFSKDKLELVKLMEAYPEQVLSTGIESRVNDLDQFESLYEKTRLSRLQFDEPIQAFYEIEKTANWDRDVLNIAEQISDLNDNYDLQDGFKLRCGGVKQQHFPTPEECAAAINTCRDQNVPMKFTAGLHHPIRHFSESVQTKMYGFFNIFIGGMLSHTYKLDNDRLVEIIKDENPEHFQFSEEEFAWKNLELNNSGIQYYRSNALSSYGSCSFDEPRDDLKNLGLL